MQQTKLCAAPDCDKVALVERHSSITSLHSKFSNIQSPGIIVDLIFTVGETVSKLSLKTDIQTHSNPFSDVRLSSWVCPATIKQ